MRRTLALSAVLVAASCLTSQTGCSPKQSDSPQTPQAQGTGTPGRDGSPPVAGAPSDQPPPSAAPFPEAGRAAVRAYTENVRAFSAIRCRYRYTCAKAASVEDALAGRLNLAASCDIRHLADGDVELLDCVGGPPPPPGPGGLGHVPIPFGTMVYLADGKRGLWYDPGRRAVDLARSPGDLGWGMPRPLNAGLLGRPVHFGPDVMESDRANFEATYGGPGSLDGLAVIDVRFRAKEIGEYTFALDPKRGHLPARLTLTSQGETISTVYLTAAREVVGRWFPERYVTVSRSAEAGDPFLVLELRLLELEIARPERKEFALRVPAGVAVRWQDKPFRLLRQQTVVLQQDEVIDLDSLPRLYSRVEAAPKQEPEPPPWLRGMPGVPPVGIPAGPVTTAPGRPPGGPRRPGA